jgi:hypothetical protein
MTYTFVPDDIYFLLDHKHIALFGSSDITDADKERRFQRFIQRNEPRGLVDAAGEPSSELRHVLLPILNNSLEVCRTNAFETFNDIVVRATLFVSDAGMTFARMGGRYRLEFALEEVPDEQARERVLERYFKLDEVAAAPEPFEAEFEAEDGWALLKASLEGDEARARELAQAGGADYERVAAVIEGVRGKRIVHAASVRNQPAAGTCYFWINKDEGMVIRKVNYKDGQGEVQGVLRFEALGACTPWQLLTDFKGR